MLSWLKKSLYTNYIQAERPERVKQLIPLQRARTLGIISTITDEDSYKNIFSLFTQLQNNNREVKMVAYIDEKTVPYYCLQQLKADYFCKKEVNWYGKLMMVQINDFIQEPFDMLIDFSALPCMPILSIARLSKAKLIVGGNQHHAGDYDIFIDRDGMDNYKLLENIALYSQKLTGTQS